MTGLWPHAKQERMKRWIKDNFSLASKHPSLSVMAQKHGSAKSSPKATAPCYNCSTGMCGIYWTRAAGVKGKIFLAKLLLPQLARCSILVFERFIKITFHSTELSLDNNCTCPRRHSTSWLKSNSFVKLISHIFQFHQFSFKSSSSFPSHLQCDDPVEDNYMLEEN